MDKQKLIFVKDLTQKKHDQVSDASEEIYNKIASDIFNNGAFYEVIIKLFGAQYLGQSKIEFPSDPKECILMHFELMTEKINKEIHNL